MLTTLSHSRSRLSISSKTSKSSLPHDIILLSFLFISNYLICSVYLLKFLFASSWFVWMILDSSLPKCFFDFLVSGIFCYSQYLVIVLFWIKIHLHKILK
jgi:hypothetical protein